MLYKLWFVASTIPFSNINGDALPDCGEYINIIHKSIYSFIWGRTGTEPLSRQTLTYPLNLGGLNLINIPKQALALRSKQLVEALTEPDGQGTLPALRFTRYYLAKINKTVNGQVYLYKPYTHFLENYRRPPTDQPYHNETQKYNYDKLIELAEKPEITSLFNNPSKPPTCKKIYKALTNPGNEQPRSVHTWREVLGCSPPLDNTWLPLNCNYEKSILWRIRHFILHFKTFNVAENPNDFGTWAKCKFCKNCPSLTREVDETHLHILFECKQANNLWDLVYPILDSLNHHKINPDMNRKMLILGVHGKDKTSTIANTLITIVLNKLWRHRNELVFDNKLTSPQTMFFETKHSFKEIFTKHYLIAKKSSNINDFKSKWE